MQSLRDDFFALFRDVNKGDWQALFGTESDVRHVTRYSWHGSNLAAAMEPGPQKVESSLPTVRQMCMFDDRTSDNLNHVR